MWPEDYAKVLHNLKIGCTVSRLVHNFQILRTCNTILRSCGTEVCALCTPCQVDAFLNNQIHVFLASYGELKIKSWPINNQTVYRFDGYNKERENSWTYPFNNYGDGVQSMATKMSRVLSSVHAISLLPDPTWKFSEWGLGMRLSMTSVHQWLQRWGLHIPHGNNDDENPRDFSEALPVS